MASPLVHSIGTGIVRLVLLTHRLAVATAARVRRLAAAARPRPSRRRTAVGVLVVAVIGVVIGLQLGGSVTEPIGPGEVTVSARLGFDGHSEIVVPPVGKAIVDSHDSPLVIRAALDNLDSARTKRLMVNPDAAVSMGNAIGGETRSAFTALVIRAIVAMFLGAVILAAVVFRRRRRVLQTAATAVVLVIVIAGLTAVTFRPKSILEPRFEGLMSNLPAVIGDGRRISENPELVRKQAQQIVDTLSAVYETLQAVPETAPSNAVTRVLHVSDIQSNPATWQVVTAITQLFKVDLIVDTGDLTRWGTFIENGVLVSRIGSPGVPYVFVAGDQDSQGTLNVVAQAKQAVILRNSVATVKGLVIAGIGSPAASTGTPAIRAETTRAAGELSKTVDDYNLANPHPVDLILTHEPDVGAALGHCGPVVLAGHERVRRVVPVDDDTLLMVQGATGGNGVADVRNPQSAFGMSVLYFDKDGRMIAYDDLTVSGSDRSDIHFHRMTVGSNPATSG